MNGKLTNLHKKGLRTIALFELAKGVLVFIVGLGLLDYVHENLQKVGLKVIIQLGLNPHDEYERFFLQILQGISERGVLIFSLMAFFYTAIRFTEAYGLWRQKEWAQWLGILSGGMYLPFEFYELSQSYSGIKLTITIFNIFVVLYLIYVRVSAPKERSDKPSPSLGR